MARSMKKSGGQHSMTIREILQDLLNGIIPLDEAEKALKLTYIETIEHSAVVDHHRRQRTGIPEVIHGEHKEPAVIIQIAESMVQKNGIVMITRSPKGLDQELPQLENENRIITCFQGGTVVIKQKDYHIHSVCVKCLL